MRHHCMWAAVVVVATLVFTASAHADGLDYTPGMESAPLVQRTDVDAAVAAAVAYWSRVPGVPRVTEACGTTPGVQVIRSDVSSGYGRPAGNGYPCRVWLTDTYLALYATLPTGTAYSRSLCPLIVHEIGHTLGLGHDYTGDPATVMSLTFDGIEPADCSPPSTPTRHGTQVDRAPACVPTWSTATARVSRLYGHGHHQQARRAYRTWKRTHARRAHELAHSSRACATSLDRSSWS